MLVEEEYNKEVADEKANLKENYFYILFYSMFGFFLGFVIDTGLLSHNLQEGNFSLSLYDFLCLLFRILTAAAIEEVIFRLIIFSSLVKIFSHIKNTIVREVLCISIEASLFSLSHWGNSEVVLSNNKFNILFIYFVGGCYFAYIYGRSGSIVLTYCLHVLNNILSTFIIRSIYSSLPTGSSIFIDLLPPDSLKQLFSVISPLLMSFIFFSIAIKKYPSESIYDRIDGKRKN